MFEALRGMITVSRSAVQSIHELLDTMKAPARQFKDLRPPLKIMEAGLRSWVDGMVIMDEWERLMNESPLDCSAQPGTAVTR